MASSAKPVSNVMPRDSCTTKIKVTRMHSSRMRTAHSLTELTVSCGICWGWHACHAPPCLTCPPAMHAGPPPTATHAPCHACCPPLPHMPHAMHAPHCHTCPPPCTLPCHASPCHACPPWTDRHV